MGNNPDNPCPICGSFMHDNIPVFSYNWICRLCGNKFDNLKGVWQYYEKPPESQYMKDEETKCQVCGCDILCIMVDTMYGWLCADCIDEKFKEFENKIKGYENV